MRRTILFHRCLLPGLADGASGNRLLGINPANFPRAILAACEDIFQQNLLPSNRLSQLVTSVIEQVQNKQIRGKNFPWTTNNKATRSFSRK